jgi:hypothetical protein
MWLHPPLLFLVTVATIVLDLLPNLSAEERTAAAPARAAYLVRGDEVEASYERYRERLTRFFETFSARLEEDTDLRTKLEAAPPAPVVYGYQILPKLVPAPKTSTPPRLSASYGWSKTAGYVERDLGSLVKLEAQLEQADEATGTLRRARWKKMIGEYRTLSANQKLIASHIEYNRLWQAEIARNRHGYDVQTSLHDAVFQRQALRDALPYADPVLAPYLRARADELYARIDEATRRLAPPNFVEVEQQGPHRFVVTVQLYTDIEDETFIEGFRSAVERLWHVRSSEEEFDVKVEIRRVSGSQLYPDGGIPARGEHIDLGRHVDRFPAGGAVLTTGGNSTYVLGRAINLGPPEIAPNILAHEFGHILGFVDGYFRGYRDQGLDGFEVLEVVTDPDDIMSAPGEGYVGPHHFQKLLDATRARRP